MKKSYNPFKMIGSWIGIAVFETYLVASTQLQWFDTRDILLRIGFTLSSTTGGIFTAILINAIIGFFIGWAINSLWRKFK